MLLAGRITQAAVRQVPRLSRTRSIMASISPGPTKHLYQEQGDLYEHEATVIGIEDLPSKDNQTSEPGGTSESHIIYLDETIFHVQGGGQPFDLGKITSLTNDAAFEVTGVRLAETDTVNHLGHFTGDKQFAANDKVGLAINVDRRVLNSRLHTAGHVLGLAIRGLSREGKLPPLTETKASHYPGEARVEFGGLIEGKHKDAIQTATDELVKQALPIKICFWDADECKRNAVELPEKMAKEEGRLFRAIEVVGKGAYACGGTHVADTSAVGAIVVKKIARQKGVSKISYDVK